MPPQQPLLRSAKPTPIPQIIAAKATFNKASSTIGSLITGRIDSNTVWIINEIIVLKQNYLFMIL